MRLRYIGAPPWSFIFTILTKGNKFCDFLFAFLDDADLPKLAYSKRQEFAPKEQILAFKSTPFLRREAKKENDRIASPEGVSIYLNRTTPKQSMTKSVT